MLRQMRYIQTPTDKLVPACLSPNVKAGDPLIRKPSSKWPMTEQDFTTRLEPLISEQSHLRLDMPLSRMVLTDNVHDERQGHTPAVPALL